MTDIYTNTSAFGLMSEEMQAQMRAHPGLLEYYSSGNGWVKMASQPGLYEGCVYRAVRAPEPPKIYEAWLVLDQNGDHYRVYVDQQLAHGVAKQFLKKYTVIHLTGSAKGE